MADIDITVPGASAQMLLELIKGQAYAATELRLQNARLFGGDGQEGALSFILKQHDSLIKKIDGTRIDLALQVEGTRRELAATVENTRRELAATVENTRRELSAAVLLRDQAVDTKIDALENKHSKLDAKMNRWTGAIVTIQFICGLGLGWLGIRK
jgi:hypothetical protein